MATRKELAIFNQQSRALALALTANGATLASGGRDGKIKFWDMAKRKEIATLTGHTGPVWSVAFTADGMILASGSKDKTIKLWDIAIREKPQVK
jgi:WD40 repeat protein